MPNYKYIPASMSIRPKSGDSLKNQYTELFEQTLMEQFSNASNWWIIQEETAVGSQVYENVDVRITHLINAETGLKLGDDWKTLLFSNIRHPVELGKHYIFDNNTWLTTNTELIKNMALTCTIRRCNNTLRWIDEPTGAYYEEPCVIDPNVKEPRNYFTQGSPFSTPGGFLHIETQFNSRTNLINENQRFLFGNQNHWTGYKVLGTGMNDFKNQETYDNESARILIVDVIADFVNNTLDDVVNGIAEVNTNLYIVTLNMSTFSGSPTDTIQLTESILYNGKSVTRDMEWASSNSAIATVSGSGLVTLLTNGSCVITTNVLNNTSASASCLVTVSGSPTSNLDIVITPDINYVLEGSTNLYSVYLYEDGVQQADTFTITCSGSNIPATSYTFLQTDSNHFSLKNNLRNDSSYLIINCVTSGSYVETYDIHLKGAW